MSRAPKITFRPAAGLVKDPRNARLHSPSQIAMIANSIRRFGWTFPMLVDDVIRAGNGRIDAANLIYGAGETIYMAPGKAHGGTRVPAGHVPVIDCTGWSDEEREAYGLADNQIALQAAWDHDQLTDSLDALAQQDWDLTVIGFDQAALDALAEGGTDGEGGGRTPGDPSLRDSDFQHVDQYGVIVMCKDEAEQRAIFERLRDEGLSVKVVVV
ncbi:MAG: ParB/Srx family N-terminal domain-containing protein [Allosphingosinicella sp.]